MSKFNDIIQSDVPTLVDFHATWCGPCKMMSPILEQYKTKQGNKLRILKIDVDKNPSIAQHFQVQGVPTLIIFQNGLVKWRQSGVVPAKQLKVQLDKLSLN